MRFGLPDDIETAVSTDWLHAGVTHSGEEPWSDGRSQSNATVVTAHPTGFCSLLQSFYDSLDKLLLACTQAAAAERARTMQSAQRANEYSKRLAEVNRAAVSGAFDALLKLQLGEVAQLLQIERQRRAEAQKKAHEERQKAEEDLKRAQEQQRAAEAQRREKEEQERKMKAKEEAQAARDRETAEKERQAKLLREKEAAAEVERKAAAVSGVTNFSLIEQQFIQNQQQIADIKTNVVEKLKQTDPQLRKAVSALKRKINPKFGQLSNSFLQLTRITQEVIALIQEARSAQNELVFSWILNYVAKAIVLQAETEVTVKLSAALPLARLSSSLLATFGQEFYSFLKARIIKKCPFVIGYTCAIDSEQGRKRMGWRRSEAGAWEDDVKYDERVAGVCTMWAVMTRLGATDAPTAAAVADDFFCMQASWSFAARVANTDRQLLTNAHFVCLGNWWEACCVHIAQQFQRQGQKLCRVVAFDLTASVADMRLPGAARLLILGEDFQNGKVEQIKEMEG